MFLTCKRWLGADLSLASIILLALALVSPALGTGLVADDFFHALGLEPNSGIEGISYRPFDLFAFAGGDTASNRRLMGEGVFPWWSDPNVRLAFFRPLTCVTHLVDRWLWGHSSVLMHAQSMFWFALTLAGVGAVYRRLLFPSWLAGLALLLYAIDDARAPAVAWIANRNALVSMAFAVPALAFHDRWRRQGDRRACWLGLSMLALGLLAGETACALLGYLVAYAICLDRGRVRDRLLSLGPWLLLAIGWRILYLWTGHGVAGSGVYVDAGREPLHFARLAAVRLPLLLTGALVGPWADLWEPLGILAPELRPLLLAWSALALVAFGVLAYPVLQRDSVARFFALGSVLASLPMCSTFAHDRLLMAPCLGTMALVARMLASVGQGYAGWGRIRAVAVGILGFIHLVVGPVLAPMRAYAAVGATGRMLRQAYDSIPSDPGIARKTVVLVNPPVDPFASYFPLFRQVGHTSRPERLRWLATGATPLSIQRVDPHTLLIEASRGWLSMTSELMLRDPDTAPARSGDVVDLGDVSFEVTMAADGRPRQVRVRFGSSLEDPSLLWLAWDNRSRGYVPFRPPALGTSVMVDPVDMKRVLLPRGFLSPEADVADGARERPPLRARWP